VISNSATVTVTTTTDAGRLINLSTNTFAGTGAQLLTMGFVTGGAGTSGSQSILVRASGPALTAYGITDVMPDPELTHFGANQNVLAFNAGWSGTLANEAAVNTADAATGAFALIPGSRDSATAVTLAPAADTVQVTSISGTSGYTLAELYDDTPAGSYTPTTPRLINVSARMEVDAKNFLIAGLTVGGSTARTVLIRAMGPTLSNYGVTGAMPDPQLNVYNAAGTVIASNAGWGGDPSIAIEAATVGAFGFASTASLDSAVLVTLAPGCYTAQASSVSGVTGNVLSEVYEVP
jgi:hypothetical protein